jgi:hypothetical protein
LIYNKFHRPGGAWAWKDFHLSISENNIQLWADEISRRCISRLNGHLSIVKNAYRDEDLNKVYQT